MNCSSLGRAGVRVHAGSPANGIDAVIHMRKQQMMLRSIMLYTLWTFWVLQLQYITNDWIQNQDITGLPDVDTSHMQALGLSQLLVSNGMQGQQGSLVELSGLFPTCVLHCAALCTSGSCCNRRSRPRMLSLLKPCFNP
jgi:hypothetical protein